MPKIIRAARSRRKKRLMMKKSTLILLLLTLCLVLCSCTINGVSIGGYTYENADRYTAGDAGIDSRVENIDVSWIAGNVQTARHSGSDIRLSETSGRTLKKDEQLHWWLDGDTLYVKYAESGYISSRNLNKQLTLLLPASLELEDISISTVSANVETDTLNARAITLNTVSGNIDAAAASAARVKIDSVSGNVKLSADRIDDLKADSVSGDVTLRFDRMPASIDADTVSGDLTLLLPEDAGFSVRIDSVSGRVKGNLSMTPNGKDSYIRGDGRCTITADSVSGDVILDSNKN